MSTAKVIEVIGEGATIEAAINSMVEDVEKTVKNVKQVDIKHIQALIEDTKLVKYRVNANITFVVKH